MKKLGITLVTITALSSGLASHAGDILPTDINPGVSPTYTTADGLLTIEGYSDSASTIPANLTVGGNPSWFGVEANGALDNADTMTLQFAPGAGLTGFGDIYSRAVVSISGFLSDPGFNAGASPYVNSASYAGGVETINLTWDNGNAFDYTFSNPSASAGQTLTVSLDAATAPQLAFTDINYAPVPEPAAPSLLILGGLALAAAKRRFLS